MSEETLSDPTTVDRQDPTTLDRQDPTTLYRQNLKANNRKKYNQYLEKQKERSKNYRQNIKNDPEKMIKMREKAKLRQKQFRERLKEAAKTQEPTTSSVVTEKTKPRTRAESESQKKQWRESKRKYRQNMSSHKKVWVRKKDRERKQEKAQRKCSQTSPQSESGFRSKKTLYNVTSKARKVLPQSPDKFARVMKNLVQNSTPRKRQATEDLMEISPKVRKIDATKKLSEKVTDKCYQNQQVASSPKQEDAIEIGVQQKERSKTTRVMCKPGVKYPKWYRVSPQTECLAKNFYFRSDISTPLPQKRYANKHGPGYLMQVTLTVAFSMFKQLYNECKIGFTKFTTLRPKNVRLLTVKHWNFCVCTVCQNITYKLRAMTKVSNTIKDLDQLLDILMCPRNDAQRYHSFSCILKKCSKCFDTKERLFAYFGNEEIQKNESLLTWNHWERVVEEGKSRKVLKTKRSTVSALMEELLTDVMKPVQGTTFAEHLFTGRWQQRQFHEMKTNLPTDCVVFVMDFGKNRSIRFQDEPKSVYYTIQQVTIHPVVVFHHSPDVSQLTVRESLVFLSDDHSHDHHAVNHFFEKTLDYLKEAEIPFQKVVVFSDGCAAQYKGKGSFAYLSLKDVHVEWNFFGSDHGKSECDGEVGCINRATDIALLGRKVIISNAEDMFTWCSESHLSLNEPGSKRRFFLVKKGDIKRENKHTDVQTLQGSRKLHHVSNVPGSPYKLLVKKLTCYCSLCRNNQPGECVNAEYTGTYVEKLLQTSTSVTVKPKTRSTIDQSSSTPKTINTRVDKLQQKQTPMKSGNNSPPATVTTPESETRQVIQPADSTPLTDTISDSIVYWERLMKCQTYKEVQLATLGTVLPPLPSLPEVTFVTHKRVVDNSALKLLPDEVQCMGLLPTTIYGDGNCLPRCGSVLVYGDEGKHLHIRARIIMELVANEAKYLDDKFLEKGSNVDHERKNFARQFAMFSEHFLGEQLTNLAIQRVFQAEVLSLCRSGRYMGIWQVAALSNILATEVVSVYPRYGGQTVRNYLNRTFVPFEKVELNKKKVYIMWSNIQGNQLPEKEWRPNHFVTLLRMFPDEKKELASVGQEMQELSPIAFLDDSDDDFCDTSFINGIINDLNLESPTMKPAPSALSQGHQDLEQPIHKQQDLKQPSPKQPELVQPFSEQPDLDKPDILMPTVEQAPLPHAKEQPFPKPHDLEKPPAKQQYLAQPLPMQPDLEQPSPQQLDLEQQIPMQPGPVSHPCDGQTVMNDHTGNGDDKQTVDGLPLSEDSTKLCRLLMTWKVFQMLAYGCSISRKLEPLFGRLRKSHSFWSTETSVNLWSPHLLLQQGQGFIIN